MEHPMIHWLASLPWLLVACMVLPIACLGLFSKTYPTARWAWPFAAFFLLSFGVLLHPLAWIPLVFFEVLLGLIVTVDYFLLAGASHLRIERAMQRAASIAAPHPIKLTLWNNRSFGIRFDIVDDIVDGLSTYREFESMDLGPEPARKSNIGSLLSDVVPSISKRFTFAFKVDWDSGPNTVRILVQGLCMSILT